MQYPFASLESPVAAVLSPMLGAIDAFWIFVAIAIGTWIYDWFRKKGAGEQPGSSPAEGQSTVPPSAPPRPGAPAPTASSWEEELRRLLGEAPPSMPPPAPVPRPSPPPVPPVIGTRPRPVSSPRPVVRRLTRPPPAPVRPPQRIIVEPEEAPTMPLAKFAQSRAAYQKATQLHKGVAEHLRQIDRQTERHLVRATVPRRRDAPHDAAAAVALVRDPRTVRQAVVASFILGPPKSLAGD